MIARSSGSGSYAQLVRVGAFPLFSVVLAFCGLGLASCAATPSSRPVARQTPQEALDASAVPVAEQDGVIAADTPSAAPMLAAPPATFDALLPPLPAPSSRNWSHYAPPARPPPTCPSEAGWDGVACVTTTCAEGARFEVGKGCVRCGDAGCWPNPERTPWGNEGTAFDSFRASGALENVTLSMCKRDGGPVGRGHAQITFHPAGHVHHVELDAGPFSGTLVGGCVVAQFKNVHVPKFGGYVRTLGQWFSVY